MSKDREIRNVINCKNGKTVEIIIIYWKYYLLINEFSEKINRPVCENVKKKIFKNV